MVQCEGIVSAIAAAPYGLLLYPHASGLMWGCVGFRLCDSPRKKRLWRERDNNGDDEEKPTLSVSQPIGTDGLQKTRAVSVTTNA